MENENEEIIGSRLEAGADVEGGKNITSQSRPLFIAVRKENLAAVRMLLDYKATTSPNGIVTPLTEATKAGHIPIMKELLAKGVKAEVERTSYSGYPCLFIAASLGHVDAVGLLLDHGADPKRKVAVEDVSSAKKEIWKAGDYFEPDVSKQSRRRTREMLP